MSSTNSTPYHQLNQWEPEDSVLRADFNQDNMKVDIALHNLLPVFGVYTGTGEGYSQSILLGFSPRILLIFPFGGLILDNWRYPISLSVEGNPGQYVTLNNNGFTVSNSLNLPPNENSSVYRERNPYRYIAWR